jgi:hypothetical protein
MWTADDPQICRSYLSKPTTLRMSGSGRLVVECSVVCVVLSWKPRLTLLSGCPRRLEAERMAEASASLHKAALSGALSVEKMR